MFWNKNKPPQTKDIQAVKPYYLSYNGNQGYVQVVGRIEKKLNKVLEKKIWIYGN